MSRLRACLAAWRSWIVPALWIAASVFLVIRTGIRDRGVILDHLEFGRRLFAGEPLYAPYLDDGPLHSVYPPSFGLLTGPFNWFGERGARFAWGVLQVAGLWAIGRVLLGWLRDGWPRFGAGRRQQVLAVALVGLAGRYVLRDTHGGGGNLINLALALGALASAERGRQFLAALLLGLSLATKPTTVLLAPVLFVLGHRIAALGSLLAFGVLATLSILVHGQGLEPFGYWFEGSLAYGQQQDLFEPALHDLPRFSWMNQSLRCMVARYCGEVPEPWISEVPGYVQGLGLSTAATAWIAKLASFAVLGVTFWTVWRVRHRGPTPTRIAYAAVLCASLLTSPISWKAHHVALIPAFLVVAARAFDGDRFARGLAIAYFVLCSAGGGDLVGDAVKEWQQSLYLVTFFDLFLLGWLIARSRDGAAIPVAAS